MAKKIEEGDEIEEEIESDDMDEIVELNDAKVDDSEEEAIEIETDL